jgi:putative C-S lyase
VTPDPKNSQREPDDLAIQVERLCALNGIKWGWHGPDVLAAWVADMDIPPAPVAVDAVRALADKGDFGYSMAAERALPEAFVRWQHESHGWQPAEKDVRVVCDVMQGVETSLWLHTSPGDGVVVFTPIYPPLLGAVTKSGRRLIECPLDPDGWKLDPERLESVLAEGAKAVLLCNPHNPTGRAFRRDELLAVLDAAEKHDLLVISDEIWADLVHPGSTHVPFAMLSEDAAKRTVTTTAASKSFNLAGLRCAVMHLGHKGVRRAMRGVPAHVFGAVGSPGAAATLAAWNDGRPWLDATKILLTAQRDHLAARIGSELPEAGFKLPEATYLAWIDFRRFGVGDEPSKMLLETARVALSSGLDFGDRGAGFARLNFATSQVVLDAVIDRMVAALEGCR